MLTMLVPADLTQRCVITERWGPSQTYSPSHMDPAGDMRLWSNTELHDDYGDPLNLRASLLAQAMTDEPQSVFGDAYMVGPDGLILDCIESDAQYFKCLEIKQAFVDWVNEVSPAWQMDFSEFSMEVYDILVNVVEQARKRENEDRVREMIKALGIPEDKLSVLHLGEDFTALTVSIPFDEEDEEDK